MSGAAAMRGAALFAASIAASAAFAAPAAPPSAAPACREIAAPAVIREPGCIRVTSDIVATDPGQSALAVYADDVSIDLGGHTLEGSGAESTSAGVHALGADRFSIRNGTIRGFLYGVRVEPLADDSIDRATVEGLVVESGTARGIFVNAAKATIENNVVRDLSGYAAWPGSFTIGIEVTSSSCRIAGNILAEIYPQGPGEAVGISLTDPPRRCAVSNNVIANAHVPESGRGIALWVSTVPRRTRRDAVRIAGNVVHGYAYGPMIPPVLDTSLHGNVFAVGCTPDDTGARFAGDRSNKFVHVGPACRDTLEELRRRASGGDPQWTVRLAAAYIEQQWARGRKPERSASCANYRMARDLLEPLAKAGDVDAVQQMARVTPLLAPCDDDRP
jgi:hypothetical protein